MPFRALLYNVENLFDLADNPQTADDDFLPDGVRRWTGRRYTDKLRRVARVITAAGAWDTPAIVGLCEVENDTVLTHLLRRTPLRSLGYHYCLSNSRDRRGINVALLYQPDRFRCISQRSVPVVRRRNDGHTVRDLLWVSGEVVTGDTLDVVVCHFPSKYGGEKASEGRRMDAAVTLRRLCDSLMRTRLNPRLIVMGDFNDPPESRCVQTVEACGLRNLTAGLLGSYKFEGEWYQYDQLLVSPQMLSHHASMQAVAGGTHNFSPAFLLKKDKKWKGKRPHRTYYGYKYEAGYSDHLPVVADFLLYLPN